ncbi:MAG: DUF4468 domain-containing protein [Bacteroidota bacterium]|jgi:Domain of unknown function (DUF4468) with TBP-like fold
MRVSVLTFSILLGCLCFFSVAAQTASHGLPIDPETKKISYKDVVTQEGNPGYLYDKAIQWFNYYYLSPASVYSVQDRVNGKIEGLGRLRIYNNDIKTGTHTDGGIVTYLIKIEFKESRFRYTLTDFNLKLASRYPIEKWMNKEDPLYNPNWDAYLYQVDTTMQRLVSTLKEKMKPIVVKKDEW